jgi:hypothetical protein
MMSTWYETYDASSEIDEVEVVEETDCFILIAGRYKRTAKRGNYCNYFPTLEEAIEFQREALNKIVAKHELSLRVAKLKLADFEDQYAKE